MPLVPSTKSRVLFLNLSRKRSIVKEMMDTSRRTLRRCLAVLLFLSTVPVFAQVTFSDLDLAEDNRLIFRARADFPGHGPYDTLFRADLGTGALSQLTVFPEAIALLRDGTVLQIQNRFGVFRSDDDMAHVRPIDRFPSFVTGGDIAEGKVAPMLASPDGRYLLVFSATSASFGDLVLLDAVTGSEEVISRRIELRLDALPVVWSPSSDYFVYAKAGTLYYFSIRQLTEDRVLGEGFRRIGNGQVSNVRWGQSGELYYVSGTLVYQILAAELFTRSLYQDLLSIGTIVGRIPFAFDSNFDSFWISPSGANILFNKGGRHLFLYRLATEDFAAEDAGFTSPYLLLPRTMTVRSVLWSASDEITIFTAGGRGEEAATTVYRISPTEDDNGYEVRLLEENSIRAMALAPGQEIVAILTETGVSIRSYGDFSELASFEHEDPLHLAWIDSASLVVSGSSFTEVIDIERRRRRFVSLSQPDEFGFDPENGQIVARSGELIRVYDPAEEGWQNARRYTARSARTSNGSYRVYLNGGGSGPFSNLIMVRNVIDLGTAALFEAADTSYVPLPDTEQELNFEVFNHGSRIRRRQLSLVFNAIAGEEGLQDILDTLTEYDITATFFVNGDFIRRHPAAVGDIADAGHEVGSLFYTYFNMADARFQVSGDFIRQGLARNEDDYYDATGRELSLLWHTPFYFTNSTILAASREMNYSYVGRDVDALDWVARYGPTGESRLYLPTADLVERIMQEARAGSIIAMTIGRPRGEEPFTHRGDYLFHRLDLLINNLLERGYEIVPVSTLMENAR